ncbi:diguanylate cyclase domain-containing protein [Rugosibacter aromaticivorans]
MDGLKTINDQHGHQAGDVALKALAQRVKDETRDSDTVDLVVTSLP